MLQEEAPFEHRGDAPHGYEMSRPPQDRWARNDQIWNDWKGAEQQSKVVVGDKLVQGGERGYLTLMDVVSSADHPATWAARGVDPALKIMRVEEDRHRALPEKEVARRARQVGDLAATHWVARPDHAVLRSC